MSTKKKFESVRMDEVKKGDRIAIRIESSGPKMGTVVDTKTEIIPSKSGNSSYTDAIQRTMVDVISDQKSPYTMVEDIIVKRIYEKYNK
jgi:hypothetical protein